MNRMSFGMRRSLVVFVAVVASASSITAAAFSVPVHLRMTREEVQPLRASVNGESRGFSDKAIEQIGDANEAVDNPFTYSAALWQSDRHFTNEQYSGSSQWLIDLRQEIIESVTRSVPNGSEARKKLGQALHTIQDFYSHSNWVERGNADINYALGAAVLPNPSPTSANCPADPNVLGPDGGGTLTSAYYLGLLGCSITLPENKCYHGNYMPQCIGINKDLDAAGAAEEGVPQNPFHPAAASLARKNTGRFVQGILDELTGNEKALSALLDVKGTLGFVVDDTGSMGSSIDGVVSTIDQIVGATSSNPEARPDHYLLVRFGDPVIGSPFITYDAVAIRDAVAAIDPYGGGDCPEFSQRALLSAIEAAAPRSHIYLFTDASAKDSPTVNQVIARAQAKGTKINYALTGSCSPIDQAYIRGAAETGGQLFRVQPHQISKLFSLIRPQLEGDLEIIANRTFDLGSIESGGGTRGVDFPVDSRMTHLVVSSTITNNIVVADHVVKLFRPSGSQVSAADPGVSIETLSSGVIVSVEGPEAGIWHIEFEGYGPLTATVLGNSPITFDRFDFVEPNPDIHGGYAPVAGQPLLGDSGFVEASVLGSVSTANFKMIDNAGNGLGALTLLQNAPSGDPEHFIGTVAASPIPFRIAVEGTDENGSPYRREYPAVYRAQPLAVSVNGPRVIELVPDESKEIEFLVKNNGSSGTFLIEVAESLGFVISTPRFSIDLQSEQEASILAVLKAPQNATAGLSSNVVLTATRLDNRETYNSASANILVQDDPMVLRDGIVVTPLSGRAGEEVVYQLDVPDNLSALDIITYGGSGDLSLYVGIDRIPTTTSNDGQSVRLGNDEYVRYVNQPTAGRYYVMVRGVQDYADASLMARFVYPIGVGL